jgi:cytochrome P450
MQRRTDLYGPDAAEFRPDRWAALKPGWSYIPFSGGPRICIGQQFALMEAGYTTVRMLQEFKRIESRDQEPYTELLTITLSNRNGTKVALFV